MTSPLMHAYERERESPPSPKHTSLIVTQDIYHRINERMILPFQDVQIYRTFLLANLPTMSQ